MSFILKIAKWTQPDFYALAKDSNKIQMLTLTFSHFVEIARICLCLQKIDFQEHGYVPGQHVLPVLAARSGNNGNYYTSDSSYVRGVDAADIPAEKEQRRARKSRMTAVPFAILPSGQVLNDSWSIAEYSGLPRIDDDFKSLLDNKLGPLTRQLAYSFILHPRNKNIWDGLCTEHQSIWWKMIWWLVASSNILKLMTKLFRPMDVDAVGKCRDELKQVVSQCDHIISNKKTRYLGGDAPGIADVALCSLYAPLISPPNYCQGKYYKWFSLAENQDPALKVEMEYWKSTITGKYCLEFYEELRVSQQYV